MKSRLSEYLVKRQQASIALLISIYFMSCAAADNRAPGLLNLQDQVLVTNQNFQFEITAFDNDNDIITFDFVLSPPPPTPTETSGGVPTLQKVSDYRAIFSWTPGNADVGAYALTVIVTDEREQSSQETVNLIVMESGVIASQWGRFTEPLGEAAILNLSENTCFETAVVIVADQFVPEEINVQLVAPSPINATLTSNGLKRYQLIWCPVREEISNQVNFPFILRATNTRGLPPIEKKFLVRLRSEAGAECPGAPPSISHQPLPNYSGVNNVVINVDVSDDIGVKSAPTLFYQLVPVIDELDPNQMSGPSDDWDSSLMSANELGVADSWTAIIPAPQDAMRSIIYYKFLVSDDDDAEGPNCDHTIESEVFQMQYTWENRSVGLGEPLCTTCINDIQCGGDNDHCLLSSSDGLGVCGQECSHDLACPSGYLCQEVVSINQQMSLQCISENACGAECITDQFEAASAAESSNNMPMSGTVLSEGRYEALSICSGDRDYYQIDIPAGETLTARIEFLHRLGDLDLRVGVLGPMGFESTKASLTVSDHEEVILSCVESNMTAIIHVFGHSGAVNNYSLQLDVGLEQCVDECVPDLNEVGEGNQSTFNATWADLNQSYQGTICPQDIDMFGVNLQAGEQIEVRLDHEYNQSDLDLDILDDYNTILASASTQNRDFELLEYTPSEDGEYYIKVFNPEGAGSVSYTLNLRGGDSLCSSTSACPLGQYCNGSGACVSNACQSTCEAGHSCVSPIAGRVPIDQNGTCAPLCQTSQECRSGESCKAFENYTKRCVVSGSALIAQSCQHFMDCAGQMVCLPSQGGYCATAGCRSTNDCSGDALCDTVYGVSACLKRCVDDADCGRADLRCDQLNEGKACIPL